MSILTPEIADTFGALDDTCFESGDAFDAHILRTMARSGNRLVTKGHQIVNPMWPIHNATGTEFNTSGDFEGVGAIHWKKIYELRAPKKPMLHRAEAHLYANITSGATMEFQIVTSRQRFRDEPETNAKNVISCLGTGSLAWYEVTDLPISLGSHERFEIWVRGLPIDTLMDTATYGSPNQFTIPDPAGLELQRRFERERLYYDAAGAGGVTWLNSHGSTISSTNMVEGGHYLEFRTAASGGGDVVARRTINRVQRETSSNSWGRIDFEPPLNTRELGEVDFYRHVNIKRLGSWVVGALALYARPINAQGV